MESSWRPSQEVEMTPIAEPVRVYEDTRKMDAADDEPGEESLRHREDRSRALVFEGMVGTSPCMREVRSSICKVASTDCTVLITGETGSGKELVARAIHQRSARASRVFVGVNCGAVPVSLIASELFGHERGAFTGATDRRAGRFEAAEGGTLFLDEVGELPIETQIALLRVLQEREFERVGGTRSIRTNIRVIAATNRDLQEAVADRSFRADLFYRLNVFPLDVPSLRDRRQDIPLLAEHFAQRCSKRAGKRYYGVDHQTLALLQAYEWPGNIRELQNVIERAVIMSETGRLSVDVRWLSTVSRGAAAPLTSPPRTLLAQEKVWIEGTLAETKGRVSGPLGAAVRLGMPPSTLESRIKALAIDKRQFKVAALSGEGTRQSALKRSV
jgi:transcriptional regulator with GAF, ATPase, and Fis domain